MVAGAIITPGHTLITGIMAGTGHSITGIIGIALILISTHTISAHGTMIHGILIHGMRALHGGTTMILGTGATTATTTHGILVTGGMTTHGIGAATTTLGITQEAGIMAQDISMTTIMDRTHQAPWWLEHTPEDFHQGSMPARASRPDHPADLLPQALAQLYPEAA